MNRSLSPLLFLTAAAGVIGTTSAEANTPLYQTEPAFAEVSFTNPVELVFAPGETERFFVVERAGRVAVVRDRYVPKRDVFIDISARLGDSATDFGLLALAFHPDFASNGEFFLWYSVDTGNGFVQRLGRFTVDDPAHGVASLDSEVPLISRPTRMGSHDGGQMFFGADGYLYLAIGDGDAHGNTDTRASRQRIDRDFFGMVVRIDVDQRPENLIPHPHPSVHPGTYRVPADNPFVGVTTYQGESFNADAGRTEIFALGLRNPFRMTRDAATGAIWVADVGLDEREEVNIITAGGNYGWPYREGFVPGPETAPATADAPLTEPIWDYAHDQGLSLTGGVVYRGDKFPEFEGAYLCADFVSGRIWALFQTGESPVPDRNVIEIAQEDWIVDFTTDPLTGDVLICDLNQSQLQRLARTAPSGGLVNLSARARVGQNDDVLIPGFVINDGPKRVLIRGVGPALRSAPFNIGDALTVPQLSLFQGTTPLSSNSDWTASPDAIALRVAAGAAGAFALPNDGGDSAILTTLDPGAYTAVMEGGGGETGVGLVEVYDLDRATNAGNLANLAVRGRVGGGNDVLTAGLVVSGSAPQTVLLRAVGPGLLTHGVADALTDPVLTLLVGSEIIARNQGWFQSAQAEAVRTAAADVGAFPLDESNSDSALLIELAPGAYTLQATSASGSGGVALIEVYQIKTMP
ncbi:PQQ-dependent sugar dehydrogenase [Synoicihabitans lomoniglobus]|uniref:PQQ-dependent sugar dehydrogenase n=1 Tax=Synoicihabitans lomoniglobus TaxID=2909285 RepID=A0AAF0CQX1_9BACT|nr:PQQ-dependent sugar dehydrogenase [Opitutaceae bacterium LMO-M01]WED66383.1 PQQ-dependent sugar dehydrogenase [Opitutaceae bacterium LMO-M01]